MIKRYTNMHFTLLYFTLHFLTAVKVFVSGLTENAGREITDHHLPGRRENTGRESAGRENAGQMTDQFPTKGYTAKCLRVVKIFMILVKYYYITTLKAHRNPSFFFKYL